MYTKAHFGPTEGEALWGTQTKGQMIVMEHISPAYEDYLEAIYELSDGKSAVRSVDVAEKLNVSKASVNKAVKALKAAELVDQPYYGDITLTDEGRAYGSSVLLRHHMLRSFLIDLLGVDPDVAEDEACAMEHSISDDTMHRWVDFLHKQGIEPEKDTEKTHAMHQLRALRQERSTLAAEEEG